MTVGQAVGVGNVLVELDSEAQKLQIEEERSRQSGLAGQIKTLQGELKAEEGAQSQIKVAAKVERAEAGAKLEESKLAVGGSILPGRVKAIAAAAGGRSPGGD